VLPDLFHCVPTRFDSESPFDNLMGGEVAAKGEITPVARQGPKEAWSKDCEPITRTGCEATVAGEAAKDDEAHIHQADWW
jgi:hypothetical protein